MVHSISQAAKKMNLSTYTLRYYDKEGLLPMIERSNNGVRVFKEEDLEWLRLIHCLKASGMPIKEIKQFLDWQQEGNSTLEKRRNLFYQRKAIIEQQIADLEKTLNSVKYKCWFYDTAVAAGSAEAPSRMPKEEIPSEIRKAMANSNLFPAE